ncbi:MAG: hypothetical protein AAB368_16850, partial [bacterium]
MTYRIVVSNTGSATLDAVRLTDTVSPLLVGQGSQAPPAFGIPVIADLAPSGTHYDWSASGLTFQPGQAYTFTITGLMSAVCAATPVSATAQAAGNNLCVTTTGTPSVAGPVVSPPGASVAVAKSHLPLAPSPGSTVCYTLVVTNTGSATLTSLAVSDTLPGNVAFTGFQENSAGLAFSQAGAVLGWSGAVSLAPLGTVTIAASAYVGCIAGTVDNVGYARAASACVSVENKSATDTFTISGPAAALTVSTSQIPAGGVGIGGTVTYRIVVRNTGGATPDTLRVSDTLPAVLVNVTTVEPTGFAGPVVTGSR